MIDMPELKKKWNNILNIIKNDISSDAAFATWIKPLIPYSINNKTKTIYILIQDEINTLNYISKRYTKNFIAAVYEEFSEDYNITFIMENDTEALDKGNFINYNDENRIREKLLEANLNEKYTFDNFIVGSSNNFAHAYALQVAESADSSNKVFNPLFLYGGAGLGKTHLMQAIAHYIIEHNPNSRVLYVSSETFINELIASIRNPNPNEVIKFRNKYRNIDVLLIDDIQFIIGKDRGQEEFFHTFNTLYESSKQVVISSDKHPRELSPLEERLRSRFEIGLSVDISSPDYETRVAILQNKASLYNFDVDNEVLQYIASNVVSNIRELEGALNRIIAYSRISPTEINLDIAKEILKDTISPNANREITCDYILENVANYFNISINDLTSKKKSRNIAYPRQIAMYLCRYLTDCPFKQIAKTLDRDHSTVMHGCEKINQDIAVNEQLRNDIEKLKKIIKQS
ncbi:chromosomal replication initiator protein [Lachnospiraceae bacterium RM5]|nr:chromosomal replication initiator protein [Lachnospiraceae bacterium RM5]